MRCKTRIGLVIVAEAQEGAGDKKIGMVNYRKSQEMRFEDSREREIMRGQILKGG